MFAIDCVLTVIQLFACVLVPCVPNWCEETVTVICPEVTMCNGPVLIWWNKYMIYIESAWEPHIVLLYERLQNFETKDPSEGSDVSSSKKREQQIRQQHNASCCPVTDDFSVKRLESQGNNMMKTLVNV